eukprot:CAMPEP_0194170068 /NCGR_PEP_ID=MMETSP0154-20130528/4728_1 /TAXON_ID=1049557 /ORGANISM="Thalassiothrix antarctica, Strain L6-D1" /LENGTH=351 /DNA_ID=CAMNT_0038881763 /DNA_START=9 /DNA_END=1064 /DNA_ORIENTATION=+
MTIYVPTSDLFILNDQSRITTTIHRSQGLRKTFFRAMISSVFMLIFLFEGVLSEDEIQEVSKITTASTFGQPEILLDEGRISKGSKGSQIEFLNFPTPTPSSYSSSALRGSRSKRFGRSNHIKDGFDFSNGKNGGAAGRQKSLRQNFQMKIKNSDGTYFLNDASSPSPPSLPIPNNFPSISPSNDPSTSSPSILSSSQLLPKYPKCDICRRGSQLQYPEQSFEISSSSISRDETSRLDCRTADFRGGNGLLSPEHCQLSKDQCNCIRQDLHQWPELIDVTMDDAIENITKQFQGIKEVSFQILFENNGDNAISSAVVKRDVVELYVRLNDNSEIVVTKVPTCYCTNQGGNY